MATTFASLGLGELTKDEKRVILRELADEIDDFVPGGFATREDMHAELRRRVEADDANPEAARDFYEVYDEIMQSLDAPKASK